MGQLNGRRADRAGAALHQDDFPRHRAGHVNRPMSGDRRDAQTGPLLERDARGQRHRLFGWNHRELGRRPKGPIGLRAVAPDALPDPILRDALANRVDHARAIAVGDDPREGHAVAKGVLSFLDVAWIDARCPETNPNLAGLRLRVSHLADGQDGARRTLLIVPGRFHMR